MSNRRITQHREKRDASNRERAELKKQNQQLRRQVARLRKKVAAAAEEVQDLVEEPEAQVPPKPACPKCSSTELGEIKTPNGKVVMACRACKGWRSTAS